MAFPIHWPAYQTVLDNLFHRERDPYPAGSAGYEELKDFTEQLTIFMTAQAKRPQVDGSSSADPEAAERLGIPAKYDLR
jgi:hypothetical protein